MNPDPERSLRMMTSSGSPHPHAGCRAGPGAGSRSARARRSGDGGTGPWGSGAQPRQGAPPSWKQGLRFQPRAGLGLCGAAARPGVREARSFVSLVSLSLPAPLSPVAPRLQPLPDSPPLPTAAAAASVSDSRPAYPTPHLFVSGGLSARPPPPSLWACRARIGGSEGGAPAMERVVEPWEPEDRERLSGAGADAGASPLQERYNAEASPPRLPPVRWVVHMAKQEHCSGSEDVEISPSDEYEQATQEVDLVVFKEEEDLSPDNEVGNVSQTEGIQTWDDLWVERDSPDKDESEDSSSGPQILGEPRWAQGSDRAAVCGECGKCFRQMSDLVKHHRTHTGEKPYKCGVCGKGFGDSSARIKHQRTHSGEKPFRAQPTAQPPAKMARARIPAGERPTICGECGKSFRQSSDLVKHQRTHTGEKPYKCGVCGKGFGDSSARIKHQRTHRGEQQPLLPAVIRRPQPPSPPPQATVAAAQSPKAQEDRPYSCNDCGKRFVLSCSLLSHQRSHLGPKPFSCDVCGKEFARGSDLVKHLRVHTGEKPYLCPECGKGFADSSARVKHLRTHGGARPHACPECDRTFSLSSTLLRHRLTHMEPQDFSFPGYPLATLIPSPPPSSSPPPAPVGTSPPITPRSPSHSGEGPFGLPSLEPEPGVPQAGEPPPPNDPDKPHKCPECGKGFRRTSDLVKHHRVHTGEKPYLCPECGKSFADSSARVKHLRTHRSEQALLQSPSGLLRPHNLLGPGAPQARARAQPAKPRRLHVCSFCGKEFPRSSDLVKHRRTHTGEKPYKCAECGKGFSDSSARIKHQRGHMVIRPFERPYERPYEIEVEIAMPLKEEPPTVLE